MDGNSVFSAAPADNSCADAAARVKPTDSIDASEQRPNQPVTLADYIYPAIQKQYIAILTHESDVLATGDLEAVHQMRVSLRRLRSILQAFAPIIYIPKVMGNKPIGKIAKILGKVRDLDVLQQTCKHDRDGLPGSEREYLEEVRSKLIKRRRKAVDKAQTMLVDREYQYFKLALNNWLNDPQYTAAINVPIESILPDLLLSVVGQLFLNPAWWVEIDLAAATDPAAAVAKLLKSRGAIFHGLRKQVKATRYLMELFPDRYNPLYNDYLKDFKQIHQLLGSIQDSVVLEDFIQRVLGKRAVTKLPEMYAQIARDNYLTWQNWQPIQHRYQQLSTKQELQLLLMQVTIHNS
jgi:CHAD domain-containing protein